MTILWNKTEVHKTRKELLCMWNKKFPNNNKIIAWLVTVHYMNAIKPLSKFMCDFMTKIKAKWDDVMNVLER